MSDGSNVSSLMSKDFLNISFDPIEDGNHFITHANTNFKIDRLSKYFPALC